MIKIKLCIVFGVLLFVLGAAAAEQASEPMNVENRITQILSQLTLKEKIRMVGGKLTFGWTGYVPPNEKLGIPALTLTDGPVGVRMGKTTAFPVSIAMAATWDPELIEKLGGALGREALAKQQMVLLGPCVNIVRVPIGGRSFESFGEDPELAARIAVPYIKGVQKEGVIATVKHYCCNNQEWERMSIDAKIDERALHEIYLPAFKAAVTEAGVWSVMSAYNKVNGQYASENNVLLNDILKKEWGFQGYVVSDWGATHSTIPSALNGLDLEMPAATHFGAKLTNAVKDGKVPETVLDDKVRRILRAMIATGLFDRKSWPDPSIIGSAEHRKIAYDVAAEGMVLLKNKGALPLDLKKIKSVAVLGPHADSPETGGGGSSRINPTAVQTPLEAFKEKAGGKIQIYFAKGSGIREKDASLQSAVDAAKKADVAIVFAGLAADIESEGFDRESLDLPDAQKELISAVAGVNKNTVVVLYAGAPVLMKPWLDKVSAVLLAWYPGQEGSDAIADALLGNVNPSGKLPVTFPKKLADTPAYKTYPGKDGVTHYEEGIFVGYRYFDAKKIAPLFPFGYGLSYTTFQFSGLKITPAEADAATVKVTASLDVKNTGKSEGSEVVQLYVHDVKSSVVRPEKELKAFQKIELKPGEKKTVSFALTQYALSFYDVSKKKFVVEPGEFEILVGESSRDIRLKSRFEVK